MYVKYNMKRAAFSQIFRKLNNAQFLDPENGERSEVTIFNATPGLALQRCGFSALSAGVSSYVNHSD